MYLTYSIWYCSLNAIRIRYMWEREHMLSVLLMFKKWIFKLTNCNGNHKCDCDGKFHDLYKCYTHICSCDEKEREREKEIEKWNIKMWEKRVQKNLNSSKIINVKRITVWLWKWVRERGREREIKTQIKYKLLQT